jgi:hypothetical protein
LTPQQVKLTPQQVKYMKAGTRPAAAPPASAATAAAVPTAPPASAPPRLDATYYGNVAANQFGVNNKLGALGQQSAASNLALQKTLGDLAYQEPRRQLALEQVANQRGGLYSSAYNLQQRPDLTTQFANQRTAAATADTARQTSIAQQQQALEGGIPIYNQQQALASVARQIAAVQANPATGQGIGGPTSAAPPNPKGGGHYVNVGGKWQLIHAVGPGRWEPGPPPPKTTGKGKATGKGTSKKGKK